MVVGCPSQRRKQGMCCGSPPNESWAIELAGEVNWGKKRSERRVVALAYDVQGPFTVADEMIPRYLGAANAESVMSAIYVAVG